MSQRHPNVINVDEIEWTDSAKGDKFASRRKKLAAAAGGKKIGASLFEIPPGKRAFPYHAHFANEESIYVLEGTGTLRLGGSEVPVRAGDYLAFPPGEASAHQLVNSSGAALRYLCFSTMDLPEMVKYPDSGKVGVAGGSPPQMSMFPAGATVDYWKDEA
jgi:uncharacterized cupin superfamily protein